MSEQSESTTLTRRVTRRELVRLGGVIGIAIVGGVGLAACGEQAAPSTTASAVPTRSAAASPASSPAASPAGSNSAASSGQAQSNASKSWDDLLAAAKKEGVVTVASTPDTGTRQKLPAAFKQKFGIELQYIPDATAATAKLQGERAAGQYTLDVEVNGSDSIWGTLLPNGWLDPIKPWLVLPDAVDGSKWPTGSPWFRDPDGDKVLQIFNYVQTPVTVNSKIVPPSDIPTGDSLLDPKWKGKICGFDPSANGSGLATGASFYVGKGQEFATKLYKGQGVVLTRDYTQLADWVAHGTYPVGLSVGYNNLKDYIAAGITFAQLELPDVPPSLGGGFGMVVILNKAPHPNAARVFANWMASQEGMALMSNAQTITPVRNDINPTWMPPTAVPKPGVKYLDTYDYKFATTQRLPIRDWYASLLKS